MESSSLFEGLPSNRIKAAQELTKGRVLTDKLQEMLGWSEKIESDLKSVDDVVVKILGMFDNTLSILTSYGFNEIPQNQIGDMGSSNNEDDHKLDGSGKHTKTVTPIKCRRGCFKRRKNDFSFTKITSTLIDDGYAWRKYGQKKIHNSEYERNYYRCSHKFEQGCKATKQVQKTNDKPPKYSITYNGKHTCKNPQETSQIILDSPNHSPILISFERNTTSLENKQVRPIFPSMKPLPKEEFPSLGLKIDHGSSSEDYIPWDVITKFSQFPPEPLSMMMSSVLEPLPMMSSVLDYEDIIDSSGVFSSACSTVGYETDDVFGSNGFDDFLNELC